MRESVLHVQIPLLQPRNLEMCSDDPVRQTRGWRPKRESQRYVWKRFLKRRGTVTRPSVIEELGEWLRIQKRAGPDASAVRRKLIEPTISAAHGDACLFV